MSNFICITSVKSFSLPAPKSLVMFSFKAKVMSDCCVLVVPDPPEPPLASPPPPEPPATLKLPLLEYESL